MRVQFVLDDVVKVLGADGAADPIDFPIAPKVANDRLLKQTGMNAQQVSS